MNTAHGRTGAGAESAGSPPKRVVQIETDILARNNKLARMNRQRLAAKGILALNLVSSPGSGKTTLLVETLRKMAGDNISVIEGDQETDNDAARIRETGVRAIQINTGKGCHLDAAMIGEALDRLQLQDRGVVFIENVGNLVCPAGFDLGEDSKVVVLSVTEGEDKPLKYPHMFAAASLMVLNKIDLAPHVDFDIERCETNARRINPNIDILRLSARTGDGMDQWLDWIAARRESPRPHAIPLTESHRAAPETTATPEPR